MQPNPYYLVNLNEGIESDVFCYSLVAALDALCSDPSVIWNRHANQVVTQTKHWKWIEEIQIHTAVLTHAIVGGLAINLEPVRSAGYQFTLNHHAETRQLMGVTWVTPKGDFRIGLKHAVEFRAR